jgi:arginine exporter protein ArgO
VAHDVDRITALPPWTHGERPASTAHDPGLGVRFVAAVPMLSQALVAGLLAGYGIAVPVGAIAPLLISLAARSPLRSGIAAALGVATVDGVYALTAVLGGSALGHAIQPVAAPTRWVAAAVLVVLAVRTAVVAIRRHRVPVAGRAPEQPVTAGRAYLLLVGLTALNPATVVYFGALVLGRHAAGGFGIAAGAVFVAATFVASASWQLVLACGGSLLGRVLNDPRGRLLTALVASALITVLAAQLALSR